MIRRKRKRERGEREKEKDKKKKGKTESRGETVDDCCQNILQLTVTMTMR